MSTDPESPLGDAVTTALLRLHRRAPVGPLDPAPVRRAVRRNRMMIAGPVAVVLAVTGILVAVVLSQPHGGSVAGPTDASACAPLQTDGLPEWARTGFSEGVDPPFATSRSGDVVAVPFADPLSAPPQPGRSNKILWVQRDPVVYQMTVTAHLEGTDQVVTKQVPVGPSIVNMPAPGCWVMDLQIGETHDQIALRYQPGL